MANSIDQGRIVVYRETSKAPVPGKHQSIGLSEKRGRQSAAKVAIENCDFNTLRFFGNGTSQRILPGDELRTYFMVQNVGTADIYVSFGKDASPIQGWRIVAGNFLEPRIAPRNEVYVYANAGEPYQIIFGNLPIY